MYYCILAFTLVLLEGIEIYMYMCVCAYLFEHISQ